MRDNVKWKLAAGIQLAIALLYIYFAVKKEISAGGKKRKK